MTEVPNSNQDNVCGDEKMEVGNTNNSDVSNSGGKNDSPKHPYHLQLTEFEPYAWQLQECEPEMYLPLEKTKLTFVDSQKLLDEMMTKLKQAEEFAIDLEHHSYRSYIGIVCLIQISTRTEDFIVDTLMLKEELKVLNEVCTDPNILKLLHGSHADILWLQRDFGVYIINMFDTFEAAKILVEEKLSLAHILKQNCNVDVNKTYQLADWRIRPLPSMMIKYAREDAHYLLYIYDIYRNKLLQGSDSTTNLLREVYKKSAELCGMVYVEEVFNANSYKVDYKKVKGTLTPRQLECFRLLHAWRYNIAREQDESTGYTLPNKMMFKISKQLPSTQEGIIACCHPLPPLVTRNITHIHSLVMEAINYIPEKVVSTEDTVKISTEKVDKKTKEKGKLAANKSKNEPYCKQCRKRGHLVKDCWYNKKRNATKDRHDPYGRQPRDNHGMETYVGGYAASGYEAIPQGYSGYTVPSSSNHFSGCQPIPQGYSMGYEVLPNYNYFSGYEPIPQAYPMGYGVVRHSSNYNLNPRHPYP